MSIGRKLASAAGVLVALLGIAAGAIEVVVGVKTLWPDGSTEQAIEQKAAEVTQVKKDVGIGVARYDETETGVQEGKTVEEVRERNNVRSLRATEESAMLSNLPGGVYGYVNSGSVGLHVDIDRVETLKLRKSKSQIFNVEVHKTSSGKILMIAYVSEVDVTRLLDPTRTETAEIFVVFEPKNEYKYLIALPASSLLVWNDRDGEELGNFARIEVR